MRTLSLYAAIGGLLAAMMPAQDIICPDIYANAGGPGTTSFVWRNTAMHCQILYESEHWTGRDINYPITITRLQWRSNTVGTAGFYPSVQVNMSTVPVGIDWLTMNTTFATNVGPDDTIVFNGQVNVAQGNGLSPGNYVVDIVLTTPFVYNPGSGQPLLIEMDTAAGPTYTGAGTALPQMDAAANQGHNARARRNSTGTWGAAVGALSFFAPVMKFDFTEPAGVARRINYGAGCNDRPQSFYELFAPAAFDLGGTTTTVNSIGLTPNGVGGYVVFPGSNGWFTPTSPDLGLADDSVSAPQALPFTLNYTGGSTTSIEIGSNGSIWMQPGGSTGPGASATSLVTEGTRFVPLWTDLDPSALTGAGSVHFDVDPNNQVVYVTWLNVPLWELAPSPWTYRNTLQVAIFNSGVVEYRYMDCTPALYQTITGFSPGGGVPDPGSRDISAQMPFNTGDGSLPLSLNASARPVIGTSINLVTGNIPTGTAVAVQILSFTKHAAGLPLAGLGMPTCNQYVGLGSNAILLPTGPTVSFALTVPNNPGLAGLQVHGQSASFSAGQNALGVLASNGVTLELGTL